MEEQGVVIENKNRTVLIKARRSSACESCASQKTCHGGANDTEMLIEADNPVGARVGDHVIFTTSAGSILKAGMLLYLFPILSFIAGVVLGQIAATRFFPKQNADLISGVLGAVFLALAFIGLKVYSRFLEKNKSYRPQVLKVV